MLDAERLELGEPALALRGREGDAAPGAVADGSDHVALGDDVLVEAGAVDDQDVRALAEVRVLLAVMVDLAGDVDAGVATEVEPARAESGGGAPVGAGVAVYDVGSEGLVRGALPHVAREGAGGEARVVRSVGLAVHLGVHLGSRAHLHVDTRVGARGPGFGGSGQEGRPVRAHNGDMRSLLARLDRRPLVWAALFLVVIPLTHLRFGLGLLAWIAPIPLLRLLRLRSAGSVTRAVGGALATLGLGAFAWTLAVLKIVTPPLQPAMAPLFGVPIGVALTLPYLGATAVRARLGEGAAVLAFASFGVLGEWMLHGLLPFGVWGAAANTQLNQLALLQLAALTGAHGVSFVIYLVGAAAESALAPQAGAQGAGRLAAALALVALVLLGGELRLHHGSARADSLVRVAAVATDSRVGQGALPDAEEVAAVRRGLVSRTRRAAAAGARLIVWTEAATLVRPEEELAFQEELAALAGELEVSIVAGYVVPISEHPLQYRNRYAYVRSRDGRGVLDHIYDKHEPVPGEPAIRGTNPPPLVEEPALGRVSGAICYDYDFPRLARERASLGVDLVALPSSDWRGIDPMHTEMTRVRAIEGGTAILRSTRYGLSAGYDAYGAERGRADAYEGATLLLVSLPRHGVRTPYATLGDWFPLFALLVVGGLAVRSRSPRG